MDARMDGAFSDTDFREDVVLAKMDLVLENPVWKNRLVDDDELLSVAGDAVVVVSDGVCSSVGGEVTDEDVVDDVGCNSNGDDSEGDAVDGDVDVDGTLLSLGLISSLRLCNISKLARICSSRLV